MRMDPTWVATVQVPGPAASAPVTKQELGRAFVLELSSGVVRGMIDRECKTALMISPQWNLTDRDFDLEVEHQRRIWNVERTLAMDADDPGSGSPTGTMDVLLEDHFAELYEFTSSDRGGSGWSLRMASSLYSGTELNTSEVEDQLDADGNTGPDPLPLTPPDIDNPVASLPGLGTRVQGIDAADVATP